MGQRRLLRRVFFQGKPATDPGLARTLAAVLEREVYVPADPGSMGAVGVALLTCRTTGVWPRRRPSMSSGCWRRRVTGRRGFQCKDRDCRNLCRLELAEIDVAGDREKVLSGGQCPKYDDVAAVGRQAAEGRSLTVPGARGASREADRGGERAGRRRVRAAARPALRPLPDRRVAVLLNVLRRAGVRRRGAPPWPRHVGRGRSTLHRAGRVCPGEAAARIGGGRRRRAGRARVRAHAVAERRRRHLHVPDDARGPGYGGARLGRRGLGDAGVSPRLLRA